MQLILNEHVDIIRKVFTLFKSADFAIFLTDGLVIGLNDECSIMRTTNIEPLGYKEPIYAIKTVMSKKDTDFYLDDFIITIDPIGDNKMFYMKRIVDCIATYNLICISTNKTPDIILENDENLKQKINSIKAADGEFMYTVDNHHMMTLYTGILPVAKNDTINVYIYDMDSTTDKYVNFFLTRFNIVKKTGIVDVYIRYLYL